MSVVTQLMIIFILSMFLMLILFRFIKSLNTVVDAGIVFCPKCHSKNLDFISSGTSGSCSLEYYNLICLCCGCVVIKDVSEYNLVAFKKNSEGGWVKQW